MIWRHGRISQFLDAQNILQEREGIGPTCHWMRRHPLGSPASERKAPRPQTESISGLEARSDAGCQGEASLESTETVADRDGSSRRTQCYDRGLQLALGLTKRWLASPRWWLRQASKREPYSTSRDRWPYDREKVLGSLSIEERHEVASGKHVDAGAGSWLMLGAEWHASDM